MVAKSPSQLRLWWLEIVGCIAGAIAIILAFIILNRLNKKPEPTLPFHTTLGPLLSVLATITTTAITIPLSSAISQTMWTKLRNQSCRLKDIVLFDSASRSSLSGLLLGIQYWKDLQILLGVFAALAALAIGPCLQATLSYTQTHGASSIQRCVNGDWSPSLANTLVATLALNDYNHTNRNDQILQELNTNCSTGDCDWPTPVSTLGFCNACTDITSSISKSCVSNEMSTTGKSCNYTLPNGLTIRDLSLNWFDIVGSSELDNTTISYQNWDNSYLASISALGFSNPGNIFLNVTEDRVNISLRVPSSDVVALECVFYWCILGYQTSIKNGTLSQNITDTWHGGKIVPLDLFESDLVMSPPIDQLPSLGISQSTNFTVNYYTTELVSSEAIISGFNNFEYPSNFAEAGFSFEQYYQLFNYSMSEMTNTLRTSCNESAIGIVNNPKLVLDVRWPWFALPVATVLLTIIFLVSVIRGSHSGEVGVWKSNPLALLFLGLTNEIKDSVDTSNVQTMEKIEKQGKEIKVRLTSRDTSVGEVGLLYKVNGEK